MATGEQYGFVFSISFILIFATLLSTIPVDLQGQGSTGNPITPLDPSLLLDYADREAWNASQYVPWLTVEIYEYTLQSKDWISGSGVGGAIFDLYAKVYWLGIFLGQLEPMRFISPSGVDKGIFVTFTDIDADADSGVSKYTLISDTTGNAAGDLIFYWNTTTYSNSSLAWDSDELFFLHGVGISTDTNVVSLLIGLLFLQLPDVPVLVNALLVIPMWACIVFVIWFVIKESLPFV